MNRFSSFQIVIICLLGALLIRSTAGASPPDKNTPPEEALYDLVFDPNETNNLVADPRAQDALADMRLRLDRWMRETDDPLLKGDVPAPEGAVVNDPDGLSPGERTKPCK